MSSPLVECVPNFSEARRPEVVAAIQQAIAAVSGVHVLDRHSDLDHNRTVITFIGSPQAVEEAAFRSIAKAAELIDLDQHRGEHPRIGAADVVPFVPIANVTMQECIEMARRLGKRVGDALGIAVYLYEQAATRPERQSLENIRRGEYETLKTEIGVKPERDPDFGPARLGPAGATVIGARPFLIAFNVYLTTEDVSIAEKIAKAVRHSSGGLRFVKALGLLVEGRAQVSMNLTDFRKTPLARVVEMIRREASRFGVGIHNSELVGLIPEAALVDAAVWYLQLDQFTPDQILERRLPTAQLAGEGETSATFLDSLASASPTPGGGSAAAYGGAMAAALAAMAARVTIGKKKYAAVEAQMQAIITQAEQLRAELSAAVEQDAAAFAGVMTAHKLPKNTPEEVETRAQAIESATRHAARVPLAVAGKAVAVLELAAQVVTHCNSNAISDGASAGALARAALTGAGYNVRINATTLKDKVAVAEMTTQLVLLEEKAIELERQIRQQIEERGG